MRTRWAGFAARMEQCERNTEFYMENLKEEHLRDTGVDWKVTFKRII
jgi:hypothetical protein